MNCAVRTTEGRDQLRLNSKISHMSDGLLLLLLCHAVMWCHFFFKVRGDYVDAACSANFSKSKEQSDSCKDTSQGFASRITDDTVVSSQLENGFKFAYLFE